jgi:hypothetical protein
MTCSLRVRLTAVSIDTIRHNLINKFDKACEMKFNSIKEFFYRLTNSGYQRMMLPLILFTLYYGQSGFMLLEPFLSNEVFMDTILYGVAAITFVSLTTVQIAFHYKYTSIAKEIGLGLKLEQYGDQALKKMNWIAATAAVVPVVLFVTGDTRLAIIFAVVFVWFFLQWPTPKTVARQLRLKSDERKMVISRGEAFKI